MHGDKFFFHRFEGRFIVLVDIIPFRNGQNRTESNSNSKTRLLISNCRARNRFTLSSFARQGSIDRLEYLHASGQLPSFGELLIPSRMEGRTIISTTIHASPRFSTNQLILDDYAPWSPSRVSRILLEQHWEARPIRWKKERDGWMPIPSGISMEMERWFVLASCVLQLKTRVLFRSSSTGIR